ncbi:unnamed protein product [Spirodela intermedia]|uniref:Uncharacterized protein n=1 Tax=Spirodela intermedia TaxID=51605 RepID=A0A7I8JBZ2_SPIIN|nr:unnamed protein product [Spirodela intermedia]CAA6667255.1 unnamed protein product [Spirodela intermedia]
MIDTPSILGSLPTTNPQHDGNIAEVVPSSLYTHNIKLKLLLESLKYTYLGENDTLSIIIAFGLTKKQEQQVIEVLKEYKEEIGWIMTNLKEVMKKEIIKWLDSDITYAIFDSQWTTYSMKSMHRLSKAKCNH